MKGFFGRLLRVRLAAREFSYEDLPDDLLASTLGGKGLGGHLLAAENPAGADPLGPENRFILTVGPVTGTGFWSHARFGAYAKGPATGGYMESYCGGRLAPQMKGCGIDALVVEGGADSLTWLAIDENGVSFRDAADLEGTDTCDAEERMLAASPPSACAMVIGPAGENRVAFACIKSDRWRSLGRGGLGAVMGSKNLKGLTFAGERQAEIADADALKRLKIDLAREARGSPITELYQKLGTPMQVEVLNEAKCFPTRYWQKGVFEKWPSISADYMQANFEVKACGCPDCFLKCTK
ncbi:MAG: aldehyde ferredoxin oxidoreductase N-terminal domain-containing protein, partial [Planctomycetota bacterium]